MEYNKLLQMPITSQIKTAQQIIKEERRNAVMARSRSPQLVKNLDLFNTIYDNCLVALQNHKAASVSRDEMLGISKLPEEA